MRECDSCRFCCWSFAVLAVPDEIKGIEDKVALSHCQHECDGCGIHERDDYPPMCKTFFCPYVKGEDTHRPDVFQEALKGLQGDVGNYIPAIPVGIPIVEAERLIQQSRSLPAAIMVNNEWIKAVLSLDREDDGSWVVKEQLVAQWEELFNLYGETTNFDANAGCIMI